MNKTYAISMFIVSLFFFLINKLEEFNLETISTSYIIHVIFWFVIMIYMVYGYRKLQKTTKN